MTIEVQIGKEAVEAAGFDFPEDDVLPGEEKGEPDIVVTIMGEFLKVKLNARKTLDGNIIIYDHPQIDITLIPFKNKILTLPKTNKSTAVYAAQKRYFDFLAQKGAIVVDSIRSGGVYGSLEAFYPVNEEVDALQVVLLVTKRFVENDKEKYMTYDEYLDEVEEMYIEPGAEDSTEYGEVPQGEKKGTIDPLYKPYGILYRI